MADASDQSIPFRYCPKCGTSEDPSSDFCPTCGSKLADAAERTCIRCNTKIGAAGPRFNELTNRCAKCEREVRDGLHRFRKVFLTCCSDGILNKEKWAILKRRVHQERLDRKEALAYVRGDAMNFLERTLAFASADGIVTEDEERFILDLRRILDIPRPMAKPILDRLAYQKELSDIRAGNLPRIKPDKELGLPPAEKCYMDVSATYHRIGSKAITYLPGRLVASSKRLRFFMSDRIFEIDWTQIIEIERRSNGIYLELANRTGNGQYDVRDPQAVEAIIDTLARLAAKKPLVSDEIKANRINADMKLEVWKRDKGKCANCGSTSHIQFNEIMTHGKSGPTGTGKYQLICNQCATM